MQAWRSASWFSCSPLENLRSSSAGAPRNAINHPRFNVAAYELDKLLGLNLVPPAVERSVNGRPASVIWWLDGFAMNKLDRRCKRIDPPDLDRR